MVDTVDQVDKLATFFSLPSALFEPAEVGEPI